MPVKTEWISKNGVSSRSKYPMFLEIQRGNPTKIKSFRGDAAERGEGRGSEGCQGVAWRGQFRWHGSWLSCQSSDGLRSFKSRQFPAS